MSALWSHIRNYLLGVSCCRLVTDDQTVNVDDIAIEDEDNSIFLNKLDYVRDALSGDRDNELNAKDEDGNTLLHYAVRACDYSLVQGILENEKFVEINATHAFTDSALHYAIRSRNDDIVETLINDQRVDLNVKAMNGNSAMHEALVWQNLVAAKLLLQNSRFSEINSQDNFGNSILLIASGKGYYNIVDMLLINLCFTEINTSNLDGRTALHCACSTNRFGNTKAIASLLHCERFSQINAQDKDGNTGLHVAVKHDHAKAVSMLLSKIKIDINIQNKFGQTALQIGASTNNRALVNMLLQHSKVGVNIQDKNGQTALHVASIIDGVDVVSKLLLNQMTLLNISDNNGHTALQTSVRSSSFQVVKLLIADQRTDLNVHDEHGSTILHALCEHNQFALFKLLLTTNRFIALNDKDKNGNSVIHIAVTNGLVEVTKALLQDKRIGINDKNKDGSTILHIGSLLGNLPIVHIIAQSLIMSKQLSMSSSNITLFANACIAAVGRFSSGHAFNEWAICVLHFLSIKRLDWEHFLNHLKLNADIAAVDYPNCADEVRHGLGLCRTIFGNRSQAQVLHIHLVGDGKAGKSVAAKWLIELFSSTILDMIDVTNTNKSIKKKSTFCHTAVTGGRTKGVQTTSVSFYRTVSNTSRSDENVDNSNESTNGRHYNIMIHDYGGQEEFLSNHANFLSLNNSLYIIVVPLLEIGESMDQVRVRTITEILERYLFWCRYIFSVVRHTDAFPVVDHNHVRDTGEKQTTNNGHGIPMITLINSFQNCCHENESYLQHINNLIPVLERQLRNEFVLSSQIDDPHCDFFITNEIFHIIDNASNTDIEKVIRIINSMVDNTVINGEYRQAKILNNVIVNLASSRLPIFMSEVDWHEWLRTMIEPLTVKYFESIFVSTSSKTTFERQHLLSNSHYEELLNVIYTFIEENLQTTNIITKLPVDINGYKIITNPSVLSTEILGDLLWWFHKYNLNKSDIYTLRLTHEDIVNKLQIVDNERKSYIKYNKSMEIRYSGHSQYHPCIYESHDSLSGIYTVSIPYHYNVTRSNIKYYHVSNTTQLLCIDQKVEIHDYNTFSIGIIKSINNEKQTCCIEFDDGYIIESVPQSSICIQEQLSLNTCVDVYEVKSNEKIDSHSASVCNVHPNDCYDVKLDNSGCILKNVSRNYLTKRFPIGSTVLIRHGLNGEKHVLAYVRASNIDGTYDIQFHTPLRSQSFIGEQLRFVESFYKGQLVKCYDPYTNAVFNGTLVCRVQNNNNSELYNIQRSDTHEIVCNIPRRCIHLRDNNIAIIPFSKMTAMDYLLQLKTGIHSLPLVELLNKMRISIPVYDVKTNETQSWLLGLAPLFPKGEKELRFDWWPDHEIRRYYRLPDTRACFIPGYFLRLFVNMVNNKGYTMIEGYGNAAKLSKCIEGSPRVSSCEIQILLCQLSDKDQDAFIVSIAAKGDLAMKHVIYELNVLRKFIYTDSWGLCFQEFCLPLNPIGKDHMTMITRIREDLIDNKQSLDELMPRLFQLYENREDEIEGMYDNNWCQRLIYGESPVIPKCLSKVEEVEAAVQRLLSHSEYRPSIPALVTGMYTTKALGSSSNRLYGLHSLVDLSLSDIYERYSESCYDSELQAIGSNESHSLKELVQRLTIYAKKVSDKESIIREMLYRCLKIFYRMKFDGSLTKQEDEIVFSISMFNEIIQVLKQNKCISEENEYMNEKGLNTVVGNDLKRIYYEQSHSIFRKNFV